MLRSKRVTFSFKYDPFGRRIYKSSSAVTSIFAYDDNDLVEETNSSGTAVARYLQGLEIDEPLAMLRSGATSYYDVDGLGSVTSLSSAAGAIANSYTYDAFGNLTNSSGSLTNAFRYTTREFDPETNLYFYRARYYDPQVGRFLGEDPLGPKKEEPNLYAYVKNNPTNSVDPWGRSGIDPSCKNRCQPMGGGGPKNPLQPPQMQNLKNAIQQGLELACSNLQGIVNPKLRSCIQKSCGDKGTIKCKSGTGGPCKDAGGYNTKLPFIGSRTANLCPDSWGDWTTPSDIGDMIIHEFAHGCGWKHGQGGGVPSDPGKGQ